MLNYKIGIACDHAGFALKQTVIAWLKEQGAQVTDYGCPSTDSCDYPDFAALAAEAVASGACERGIVVCSSGIGVSIVANKVPGIRCAHCHDVYCAKYTRFHNDANMISLGARVVGPGSALKIIDTFLDTPFSNDERHMRRIAKIEK